MDRFNPALVLTTSQVAELLDVHSSTVKRWCNEEALPAETTRGGHRRIHLDDVLSLASDREIETILDPFTTYAGHVWTAVEEVRSGRDFQRVHALSMGWLSRGHVDRVGHLYEILANLDEVPLPVTLDRGVRGFLDRVGRSWREGKLGVADEHLVSQTLLESLLRLRTSLHLAAARDNGSAPGRGGTALVGAAEGDQHHLGALCARLILEHRGWRVLYLGASVPIEEFASMQRSREADLVCVSLSSSGTADDGRRCIRILSQLYDRGRPYSLALGGEGATGIETRGPFHEVAVFGSLESFDRDLADGFGRPR